MPLVRPTATEDTTRIHVAQHDLNSPGYGNNVGAQAPERGSSIDTPNDHQTSPSTVEDIFDQYAVDIPEGGAPKLVAKGANSTRGENLTQAVAPSESSQLQLPAVPYMGVQLDQHTGEGSSQARTSRPDSQESVALHTREDVLESLRRSLEPRPLRIPSRPLAAPLDPFTDGDESSSASDEQHGPSEDPFQYDSVEYQRMLAAFQKERDVSQALKRLAHTSTSDASFASPANSPIKRAGNRDISVVSPPQSRGVAGPILRERSSLRHSSTSSIQQPISLADGQPHKIKVVIQRASNERFSDAAERDRASRSYDPYSTVRRNRARVIPREMTSDSGWVTEATSDVGSSWDASSDAPFPAFDFKAAGSSIADYSDDETTDAGTQNGPFTSRDRILQHPRGQDKTGPYVVHNLKGANQQVLLPKGQGRDGSGFPQNSMRLFSPKSKGAEITPRRPGGVRQLSNPFRQGSYRRADMNDNFQFKRRNDPSRYEFRDSTSEYGPAINSNHATRGSISCPPSPVQLDQDQDRDDGITIGLTISNVNSARKPHKVHVGNKVDHDAKFVSATIDSTSRSRQSRDITVDRQFAMNTPSYFDYEPGSARSLSVRNDFELLPLDEAQAKLKRQRESGETDETEPASVRFKRARSRASSQALSTSTSPQPPSLARVRNGQQQTPRNVTPLRLFPRQGSQGMVLFVNSIIAR